jgi:hypothetical protein
MLTLHVFPCIINPLETCIGNLQIARAPCMQLYDGPLQLHTCCVGVARAAAGRCASHARICMHACMTCSSVPKQCCLFFSTYILLHIYVSHHVRHLATKCVAIAKAANGCCFFKCLSAQTYPVCVKTCQIQYYQDQKTAVLLQGLQLIKFMSWDQRM